MQKKQTSIPLDSQRNIYNWWVAMFACYLEKGLNLFNSGSGQKSVMPGLVLDQREAMDAKSDLTFGVISPLRI